MSSAFGGDSTIAKAGLSFRTGLDIAAVIGRKMNIHGRTDASLYEADFYSWTQQQAGLLRSGQIGKLDVANLIEEVESLGRSERAALVSAYRLICLHQLKRMFQPERAESKSWTQTIVRERNNVEDILDDNPGLRPQRTALFARAPTRTHGGKQPRKQVCQQRQSRPTLLSRWTR